MQEWIGVGLDGTLATSNHTDPEIGEPIPIMVAQVIAWLKEGQDVRILTPRIAPPLGHSEELATRRLIDDWCWLHLKKPLPITVSIDHHMRTLYMHNCVQVGQPVDQS